MPPVTSFVPTCSQLSYGGGPAAWFRWVAPAASTVTIGTCNSGTTFNTQVMVLTGAPPGCAICAMASKTGCSSNSAGAVVTMTVTANTNYHILVTGVDASSAGQFNLSISFEQNICATGTPVGSTLPFSITETLEMPVTETLPTCSRSYQGGNAALYKITGNGKSLQASTCGSDTSFDTLLFLYSNALNTTIDDCLASVLFVVVAACDFLCLGCCEDLFVTPSPCPRLLFLAVGASTSTTTSPLRFANGAPRRRLWSGRRLPTPTTTQWYW